MVNSYFAWLVFYADLPLYHSLEPYTSPTKSRGGVQAAAVGEIGNINIYLKLLCQTRKSNHLPHHDLLQQIFNQLLYRVFIKYCVFVKRF